MSDLLRAILPALEATAGRVLRPADLDVVVVHNTGPIPPVRSRSGSQSGLPGFNVVVAERGRPIYFCKCRPAGDPALAHEGAIGDVLSREPSTARHVAASRLERGDVIDVLVVQHLPGRPYHELLLKQRDAEWLASVESLMALVERMAVCVGTAIPGLRGPESLRVGDEGRWALSALEAEQGLARHRVEELAAALEAGGTMTARLQHGDLWPPNVLVDGRSWYVLDLELFGRVRVPLYDLLHMLHVCSGVRRSRAADRRPWVERLMDGDPEEAGARDLIRRTAQRQGLSSSAAFAALAYYVVDAAARVRARGAWSADWREYLAQVARLADLVAEDAAAADRLFTTDRG
ncbi:MAG: aminoglycoside phosphotransferase family protein [Gemmatimonadota bacterium]|nr:aminoglycoside phosphotransferase family protein [Gemmatimonadota bacterium]